MTDLLLQRSAVISPCGRYRYRLTRSWAQGGLLPFVMLNPSTADADIDDPTIRRCMSFARREGAAGIVVGNLFAFRATDPKALASVRDAYGPDNEMALHLILYDASNAGLPVVCSWGTQGNGQFFVQRAQSLGSRLACLGTTKGGHPRHPLYVRGDQPLEPFP